MTPPEAGNWPVPPPSAPSTPRAALTDGMTEEERQDEILRSFGLTKASERSEKAAAEAAAKGPTVNSKGQWSEEPAFIAEDGGINFLAFIPAAVQGPLESFLFTSTGVLLGAFIVAVSEGKRVSYAAFASHWAPPTTLSLGAKIFTLVTSSINFVAQFVLVLIAEYSF